MIDRDDLIPPDEYEDAPVAEDEVEIGGAIMLGHSDHHRPLCGLGAIACIMLGICADLRVAPFDQ